MTLSLSPQQLKQSTYIPLLSDNSLALKSYSNAERITEVQLHNRSDHETEPTLLIGSNTGHVTHDEEMTKPAPPSQVAPDLPSRTALKLTGNDEVASDSDPEADELSIKKATDLAATQQPEKLSTSSQATAKNANATTAGQTPGQSSHTKRPGVKRARFDGIFITTKPPPYYKRQKPRKRPKPASASGTRVLSLVDALAHTFDANKHTEGLLNDRHDNASTAAQTDVETTEAEDEQLPSNARLVRTLSHARSRIANASEPNSGDAVSLSRDILLPSGRPVKRLKPIPYDPNSALIDAALETVEASIGWNTELDVTRDEDLVLSAPRARASPEDFQMSVDGEVCTPVGNARRIFVEGNPQRGTLTPYLSRGAQFRQRLHAVFGENVTVQTNRVARPRPVDLDLDLFGPLEDTDRAPSLSSSGSVISVRSASSAEASADTSMDQPITNQKNEVGSLMKPTFDASEEQMNNWIIALQRLVKGKVHVKEEELETLSIILAEIESVKDRLDENLSMVLELRETIKQLSELNEIPFGDRNKLRQRAENVFRTWPSANRPEAS